MFGREPKSIGPTCPACYQIGERMDRARTLAPNAAVTACQTRTDRHFDAFADG
jgi:hypothetical protein